jgi:hypothetical protein
MDKNEIRFVFVAMPSERKLRVLALWAHNLTVCARSTYSPEVVDDVARKRLRTFNEILHTLTGQLLHLVSNDLGRYPDEVFIDILFEKAQSEGCEAELCRAFEWSYSAT